MEKKTTKTSAQKMALRRSKFLPALRQMGFMRRDKNTGEESPSFSMLETALIDAFVRGAMIVISIDGLKYTANPAPVMTPDEYRDLLREQGVTAVLASEDEAAYRAMEREAEIRADLKADAFGPGEP